MSDVPITASLPEDQPPVTPRPATRPPATEDPFEKYLGRTRWFGGKGRPYAVTDVRVLGQVPGRLEGGPRVVIHLVEVTYDDAPAGSHDGVELYQVPLSFYIEPERRLDHAFVGWWEDPEHGWVHAYDALHDREAMACWLRSFVRAADGAVDPDSPLQFHRLPGHDLDTGVHSTLFSGEQSNSSVAFGEDSLMKVFRKVTPGVNPDVQVHEVLTEAGSDHIAALYGWMDVVADSGAPGEEGVLQLAMLQQFLRTATDGWDLALGSVRSLFGEAHVHAGESGADFAGEATRLGEALREVHTLLATTFGSQTLHTGDLADLMTARLTAACRAAPVLEESADGLRALYATVGALGEIPIQRIHGDLHLGQTLRTSKGWKIVDFEGEPAKPLAERLLPDSPWRDVAGMLRSFDYAPRVVERTVAEGDVEGAEQRAVRADEWAHRNSNHFLVAYAGGEPTAEQQILLEAYVADKAVYETVYETRNRPTWVGIPLQAVARIGAP